MTLSLKSKKGFSLIELTVVLFIIITISTFGLPSLIKAYNNFKMKGTTQDLYSNLQKARSEAIKRNTEVTIAFNPETYTANGSAGDYRVFIDDGQGGGTAGNNAYEAGEESLLFVEMPKGIGLYKTTFVTPTDVTVFNTRGLPTNLGKVRLRNSIRWYQITIQSAGNIKMEIRDDGSWPP